MDYFDIEKDLAFLHENVQYLNQNWRIDDSPVQSHIPVLGGLITLFKRLIRKSIYWLIKPYWDKQSQFNNIMACAISDAYRIESAISQWNISCGPVTDGMADDQGPRIIQLVSSLNYGDAVGNEVIAMKKTLQENGYVTEIYTNNIHRKIEPGMARLYQDMPPLRPDDLVIYHFASECAIAGDIKNFPCKVVLRYHNITPPEFFHGFDEKAEKATANGLRQVREIQPYIDFCLPVSRFNQQCLEEMGYHCPMQVMPILINFNDYKQEPDPAVIKKYSDGITNILFVGRIAPNKKIEDVISAFAYYKEHFDRTARLLLVGSYQEADKYYQFLCRHIKKLSVKDVIFPGHISFAEILGYYKVADLFLCMSEHEGFCVPLVEAMYFHVPIIAYNCTAISSTLGKCGVHLVSKEVENVAQKINLVLSNRDYAKSVIQKQVKMMLDYDSNKVKTELLQNIISI